MIAADRETGSRTVTEADTKRRGAKSRKAIRKCYPSSAWTRSIALQSYRKGSSGHDSEMAEVAIRLADRSRQ